jgi:polyhydroxybutyrate depolymerase
VIRLPATVTLSFRAAVLLVPGFLAGCAGAVGTWSAGDLSGHTITVGERERDYLLYTPPGLSAGAEHRPLVIVFHGGGGTSKQIAKEVGPSLQPIADREGFFIVYPNAVNRTWDFGAGKVSEDLDERVDDRRFFGELLRELESIYPIDEERVFATGISRGGQASYFVVCSFPGKIRAIAPVAMPMPVFMRELCGDAQSTGVAIFNGTADPLVPYAGGQIRVGRRERGEVMPTDAAVDFWRTANGCSADPTSTETIDGNDDGMRVVKTSYERCSGDPVLLYRIEGGGHTWPNGSQYLPRFVVGKVNRDIDGSTEIWNFFSRFRSGGK